MRRPCIWLGWVRHRDGVWAETTGPFASPKALARYLAEPYDPQHHPHWRRFGFVRISPTNYETTNGRVVLELIRQEVIG